MTPARNQMFADRIRPMAESGMKMADAAKKVGMTYGGFRIAALRVGVQFEHGRGLLTGPRAQAFADRIRPLAESGVIMSAAARECGMRYPAFRAAAAQVDIKFKHALEKPAGEREQTMRVLYLEGYTLNSIGEQFGLTRERVRQLLTKHFGITAQDGGQTVTAQRTVAKKSSKREQRYLAKRGCTWAQYKGIRDLGQTMMAAGIHRERTPLGAFTSQRANAHRRGIGWELSLWQWWTIWQTSGKWEQRGRGQGYVMCRQGDLGPYAVGNVFIATARENSSEKIQKKSGLPIGVHKHGNTFVAHRCLGGKKRRLGSFPTPELAHAAYLSASPDNTLQERAV